MDSEMAATTQVPLPPPAAAPVPLTVQPKSPGLALVLSLFPGVGQIYNGQPAKALAFFFGWVACIYMAAEGNPLPFGLMIPFVYFYNLIDAYRSAVLINARRAGRPELDYDDSESPAWGWTLVVVGVVLLLNNLGWVPLHALSRFWPLLLIGVGVFLAYGSMKRRNQVAPVTAEADHGRLV